ncbi:MAG: hypothetical protein A3J59_03100 [Candidatus Buchananbacteria bacterium RIFCSPHIGHO2_02_FULL_56_16]|uniref:Uncharacterized protein n=1 Tax=Candidatus Buchananbacteria bacterium RIFCSPHIGHO2_02_FULL_56_16 TaxID=1797542 RepID=A0A1G1YI35_9BACT|nr:MAG: hypothetical protein A3J59_03100 [Candidatus Buchananbacteria bacterium RIFCSPHIGHO2_02_FULL_56_16]
MAADQPNKNDEFFQLLAAEPGGPGGTAVRNPFNDDEIVFRDERGEIKVLKGKQVTPLARAGVQRRESTGPAVEPASPPPEPLPAAPPPATAGLPSPSASIAQAATRHRQAIADTVESITASHQLKKTFAEAALEKRFKNLILSMLTGVRNAVETREMLTRPVAEGGLEFSQPEAADVLAAIDQANRSITGQAHHQPPPALSLEGQQLLSDTAAPAPPTLTFTDPLRPRSVASPILTSAVAPSSSPLPPVAPPNPIAPPRPVKAFQEPPAPVVAVRPRPAAAAETPIGRQTVQPAEGSPRFGGEAGSPRFGGEAGRPKIEDVKFKPKSMGPVEEIGALTALDFRRLGANPNEAGLAIMEKIEQLEQESFSQRIAAIRAWQDSPVYRLYLELGGASMEEKKPVATVIAERQAARTPTLTEPEFEAISDLNQKLRH